MSTRVHELAKELGLKSQDLLERIQKWGLDVKESVLASLDPSTVERIRELMKQSPAPAAGAGAAKPAPAVAPSPNATNAAAAKPTPRPVASAPASPPASAPTTAPPRAPAPAPAVGAAGARPTAPADAVATPPAPAAGPAPAPASPPPPAAPRPASTPSPAATPAGPPQPARTVPLSSPPLARSGGGFTGSRPGGGPLAGHTPHRGTGPRPGGPPSEPRPIRPQGPSPSYPAHDAGGVPGSQPLKRSDYMSSAGIRPPVQRGPSASSPAGAPPRRPGDEPAADRDRRDGPRRPLPPVAAPQAPVQRSSVAGRPTGPAPQEAKSQRPEKRMTREEILNLMRTGQLGAFPGAPPAGPGARPGAPGVRMPGAPGSGAGRAPGAPGLRPGQPAVRMPGPPGSSPAPIAPPAIVEEEDDRKGKARVGSSADRAGRRARRTERATDRRVSSPQPASALLNDDDDGRRSRGRRGSHRHAHRSAVAPTRKSHVQIEPPISVRTLSEEIGIKANELLRKLMGMGEMATINTTLDEDLASMLAMEFGVELEVVRARTAEDDLLDSLAPQEDEEHLSPRPPVITILGHVDHGKTSLLDRIRKANVVDSESGGITQHIGAYQVEYNGKPITFVDTPGHEAFTAMRARGANVTDIVVLVVAADDGVMPQTIEAIAHAKAAEVPIVVALNKIDLPNVDTPSNVNKIYGELAQQGLNPVEWGGDIEIVKTSTVTGQGVPDLLSTLETIAELHDLKADPDRPARGTCLEASLSEGRGVLATVLVQEGTLKVGDVLVCGDGFGRVRALFNDRGRPIEQAGPSTPVEISGLDVVPTAGENFGVIDDVGRAREIAETRRGRAREAAQAERQTVTLENLYNRMAEQKVKTLNLIIKADVQGSIEALTKELEKLENNEVPIRILLKGVGGITESDILLADASQAIVIGFRVAPEDRAITQADEKKIEIRRYDIIYQVTDDIKKAVEGMLVPEVKEVHLGRAVVRQVFRISKVGAVAGCFVTQGTIERSAKVRLIREGREVYKGAIDALKRFKDDVKEVPQNFECGIKITNYDDVKPDDVIEAYRVDVIRRTL
ncbi:Translation initiation factor IF-2 [Aquisphaera giovannonii]|uniref:Translation initiation factor IF-2 n=1 Tax=Aquisphaera giovannonii TaxID=406548 RepID=A0A5B9VYG6_9BACT|nr:translation initiation factor IF-2 [Aquisphaera giovannonii]QEH33037.1 Translation initiation factor IF-2 [Aquisphaera giovannonii]